jgi:hypothetical protein
MFPPFFALAAQSPTRQISFRRTVVLHLLALGCGVWAAHRQPTIEGNELLGQALLVAGIVEGGGLIGWRLAQLPKSQALEFLLVSPLRPHGVFLAEALVGLALLGLVTLSGLPVLLILAVSGRLDAIDLVPLLVMPVTWGAVTGMGLAVWAYESPRVRRWGERVMLAGILLYLVVGILAGENLRRWVELLPEGMAAVFLGAFEALHTHNPFGIMRQWLTGLAVDAWKPAVAVEALGLAAVVLCAARAAGRLKTHFHELHYQPAADVRKQRRPEVSDRPLAWWAIKRVTRYSGRINLYLAWSFGVAYAAYVIAGPHWPAWLGKRVFEVCDTFGGVPMLATALAVLAAVPAAFQYGLWDSNTQDRCRRLELLLLTRLQSRDYWEAAAAAAWRRGQGYLEVAVLLWGAAVAAGRVEPLEALGAAAAAVLLWGLYFALGFLAFARGRQATALGLLLTVGLPLICWALSSAGLGGWSRLVPPGMVHGAHRHEVGLLGLAGPVTAGAFTLAVARHALRRADAELRRWYDLHHGHKLAG